MNKLILISLLLITFLAGCAGFRQIDCDTADWAVIGYEDGENGKLVSDIEGYQETCSEPGALMDINAYNEGHKEGVRVYCRPENGLELGQSGAEYSPVCPADLSIAFDQQYIEGARYYPFYRNIGEREMSIAGNFATIGSLQGNIGSSYARMNSPDITHTERNQLRQSIDSMRSQITQYELTNVRLEDEITEWADRLREIKASYGK